MNSATNYQVIVILFNTVLAKLNQTFGGLVQEGRKGILKWNKNYNGRGVQLLLIVQ